MSVRDSFGAEQYAVSDYTPVLREASAVLSAADVLALTTTTGVELVAARANHLYIPLLFQVQKSAGSAFTTGTSAKIAVGHLTVGYYIHLDHVGLTDQTTLTTKYRNGAAITNGGDSSAAYENKALGILTQAGTFTGTGSPVTVRVFYFDVRIP